MFEPGHLIRLFNEPLAGIWNTVDRNGLGRPFTVEAWSIDTVFWTVRRHLHRVARDSED